MADTKTAKKDRLVEMAERFARETADHELTVVHDDGLYRHLRARSTKDGMRSFYWFDVVTWPGSLVIRGDCGGYMFTRTDDMFGFFRADGGSINPGYWAEKTPDFGVSAKKYSEEVFRAQLAEALADYERESPAQAEDVDKARAIIAEHEELADMGYEDNARDLLNELDRHTVVVTDGWEWDLKDWDWQFLWCCHAIVWAIARYDEIRAERVSFWSRLIRALGWRR
jgi:hypothetical protein